MSSPTISPLVIKLISVQKEASFVFAFVFLIFGVPGCFLNILLFSRRQFRTISCCTYFLAASVAMIVPVGISSATALYTAYYGPPMNSSQFYCKAFNYFSQSSLMMFRWMLAAASVDRYTLSSTNARLRSFSSVHVARRIVLLIVLIWILLSIFLLFIYDIRAGSCVIIYGYGASLFSGLFSLVNACGIPVPIMIICSLLIRHNLSKKRGRLHFNSNSRQRTNDREHLQQKRDQQALVMLFVQILFYIILITPYMIYMIYNAISLNVPNKSTDRLVIEQFTYFITGSLNFFFVTLSFYLYTLTSSMFRKEILNMLRSFLHCDCFINSGRVQPITTTNIQRNFNVK